MGEKSFIVVLLVFNAVFILFIWGIFLFITEYRKKKRSHQKKLEEVETIHKEELLQTQVEIQSQTMKHIGREIHDNVGQKLTLSSLYLQQLLLNQENKILEKEVQDINTIINDSLQELRHLSKSLTDDTIHQNSIAELIQEECKKVSQLQKCEVEFQNKDSICIHSYQIKSVLLRITQEFLQNSIKHSHCKNIQISLDQKENMLELHLKDDGIGFDPKTLKSKGIGLKNMQKRTEMIQGVFILNSEKGKGTQLTLKIPIS